MEDEDEVPEECPTGLPGWLATFADLMSLLMVFFVLILSFSEMDVIKYKQIAGSMAAAFGVQRDINTKEMPKGVSIIAQEFSPGKPEPTVINEVRQQTTDDTRQNLKMGEGTREETLQQAARIESTLAQEIAEERLEVQVEGDQVVIRILDKGSFPSASARINADLAALILKIGKALADLDGNIQIVGHTDDIPIQTLEFPSNWVLSSARAAAVAHTMIKNGGIDPRRVEIRAHADNVPLAPNTSPDNREMNRRVEIVLTGGSESLSLLDSPQE